VGGVWQLVLPWTQDGAVKKGRIDAAYDPPAFLVVTQKAEPGGGVTPGPEMRFEFEDLGGRTRLHLTQGPIDTAEFLKMTRGGWGSSLTKLDAILTCTHPHSNGKPHPASRVREGLPKRPQK
jgi:hypothetical protein